MVQYKVGDSLDDDCPGCSASKSIIYKGDNEAVCNKCGSVFEVSFEDGEQGEEPDEEVVAEPAPLPASRPQAPKVEQSQAVHTPEPVMPILDDAPTFDTPRITQPSVITLPDSVIKGPVNIKIGDVGKLTQAVSSPIKTARGSLRLDPNMKNEMVEKAREVGIPDYILKSRPWRWAHEMGNSGNPYRADSKNAIVYAAIQECPMTVTELVGYLEPRIGDKMSFILLVYEVLTQCAAAGLLVMDEQTRKFSACQGQPQPAKLP